MVQKPKSVTYKVISGYLLLFILAAGAVFFIYRQIITLSHPHGADKENKKLLEAGNTIATLYSSEAAARQYMLSGLAPDSVRYRRAIDSVHRQIAALRADATPKIRTELDSVSLLLKRKDRSIRDILAYRSASAWENTFRKAAGKMYNVKDSIFSVTPPVRADKKNQYNTLLEAFLSRRQMDSLSKLPVSNDSLTRAFSKAFNHLMLRDNRMRLQLYQKEQKMLEENRMISDQLRAILVSVEREFIDNTYRRIRKNEASVERTFNTLALAGAGAAIVILALIYVIARDLSINQQYRRRLEKLNEENQGLLKTKSMLMAMVTHDLQTPLGSIMGFNNLLQQSVTNSKQQQYLDNIQQSAEYILKLINDLLDFSKLENNRLSVKKEPVNIGQLIENTCRNIQPIADSKGIELLFHTDKALDSAFCTDAYRLRQVLTNIISNAVKFTAHGFVKVTAKTKGDTITIAVADTGIGIAPQKQADVFREFTQAHSDIERTYGGTGLGLTISKRIVELLGGTILLESEEGKGSVFTISLPAEITVAVPEPDDTPAIPKLLHGKILVVDDDAMQLALMKEVLTNLGMDVTTEGNPGNALPILERGRYDVVLSDVQMPVMDGFMFVHRIRSHSSPAINSIPVIALSGRRDLDENYYTNMGFSACHPKPVQPETLVNMLSRVLENRDIKIHSRPDAELLTSLYNLQGLSRFTFGDNDALKSILQTFITSADENCKALRNAIKSRDDDKLGEIAHKMIPMLRQMEVNEIVGLLEPVEDHKLDVTWEEKGNYIDTICQKVTELCSLLSMHF